MIKLKKIINEIWKRCTEYFHKVIRWVRNIFAKKKQERKQDANDIKQEQKQSPVDNKALNKALSLRYPDFDENNLDDIYNFYKRNVSAIKKTIDRINSSIAKSIHSHTKMDLDPMENSPWSFNFTTGNDILSGDEPDNSKSYYFSKDIKFITYPNKNETNVDKILQTVDNQYDRLEKYLEKFFNLIQSDFLPIEKEVNNLISLEIVKANEVAIKISKHMSGTITGLLNSVTTVTNKIAEEKLKNKN